jgi:hypothetical protein
MTLNFTTKDKLLQRANSLEFFKKDLTQLYTPEEYSEIKGGGLVNWINANEKYYLEKAIIDKIKIIHEVINKHGNDSINKYKEITEYPDKSHPAYYTFQILKNFGIDWVDELFIPMSKKEFNIYLEIYNEVFSKYLNKKARH